MKIDTGSNYPFGNMKASPSDAMQFSDFPLDYVNSFDGDECVRYPSWIEYTMPRDSFRYSTETICKVINPPVVPVASRQRLIQHTYYASFYMLWKKASIFFPKGFSEADYEALKGMVLPEVTFTISTSDDKYNKIKVLFDMLNYKGSVANNTATYVFNPMKLQLWYRIWIDHDCNKRLFKQYVDNHCKTGETDYQKWILIRDYVFAYDTADFRIGTSVGDLFWADSGAIALLTYETLFPMWANDYFTTSILSPNYGDVPFFGASLKGLLEFDPHNGITSQTAGSGGLFGIAPHKTDGVIDGTSAYFSSASTNFINDKDSDGGKVLNHFLKNSIKVTGFTDMTMDDLRTLACQSAISEKVAKCDGTYGSFMRAMFGITPKSAENFKPYLVHTSLQGIMFSDVVNTGAAQGTITGKAESGGISQTSDWFCDDFGICMTVTFTLPDTYYHQGVPRQDLYKTSEDFPLPERALLGLQAIKSSEIYYDSADGHNDDTFGFINRLDEWRYRNNEVHGQIADTGNYSFSAYITKRTFSSRPTLSHEFISTKGFVSDWKSANESAYFFQILNKVRVHRALPYRAEENTFGF